MVDGKKLEESINQFENHLEEMGKTAEHYAQLVDYRIKLEKTNDTIDDSMDKLNQALTVLNQQVNDSKENNAYLEKWSYAMNELLQEGESLKKQIEEENKAIKALSTQNKQLETQVLNVIGKIPNEIDQQTKSALQSLGLQVEGNLNRAVEDIGGRMTQFVDMQMQINKGMSSEIGNLKDNMMNAIQTVKEEQVKSQDEVKQLREANATKLESINKVIFMNICISVMSVIMIGILFLTFKG